MKIRFVIIFIASMIFILIASIVTSYSVISGSQQTFEKELFFIKELASDNPEVQKRITLYKAFSQKRAIETTRQVWGTFLVELFIFFLLFLLFINGITNPINRLSARVKSIYFDKNKKDLLLSESGTEEIRVLIRAFNEMVLKLKNYEEIIGNVNKYRGWKEISRIIVHEINNIISPIQTYVEFLIDRVDDTEKVFFILNKLKDIRMILQKFRDISHFPDAELAVHNIVPILKEVCREWKNVHLMVDENKCIELKIDIVLFKEVVRNLVKNATESGEDVRVEVYVEEKGNEKIIRISDNGRGMSPETVAKIFNPGYTTKKGNIGIGLSIVKSLAQEQNARIALESVPGQGTTFFILFSV